MSRYRQRTYEQRCQIEALKKTGTPQKVIADIINVNQSTVSRVLRRNQGERGYRHKQAQRKAESRRRQATKAIKMTPTLISLIELQLNEKWSPEQISGWLLVEHKIQISHERIYLHVWANKQAGATLFANLRRHGKRYQKRSNGKTNRGQIRNRTSIIERPAEVDTKSRIGDWEIDTVIGKGHSGATDYR